VEVKRWGGSVRRLLHAENEKLQSSAAPVRCRRPTRSNVDELANLARGGERVAAIGFINLDLVRTHALSP
jgi:hypothetical protein